jgi:hypothetical protein
MGFILYYSNYCVQSQSLLKKLAVSSPELKNKIYFLCIDDRAVDPVSKRTMIKLGNGEQVLLPPQIVRVPSLIVVNMGNRVIIGTKEILHTLYPNEDTGLHRTQHQISDGNAERLGSQDVKPVNEATLPGEPRRPKGDLLQYEFGKSFGGVTSDAFSYISSSSGDDGVQSPIIPTPSEDYDKGKLDKSLTIEALIEKRNKEVPPVNLPGFQAPSMQL